MEPLEQFETSTMELYSNVCCKYKLVIYVFSIHVMISSSEKKTLFLHTGGSFQYNCCQVHEVM